MSLVTLAVARDHCKADAADDTLLQRYLDAAEARVARYIQRNVYVDHDALDSAVTVANAGLVTANATYATALEAAGALATPEDVADAESAAASVLRVTKARLSYVADGMVLTNDLVAAILLLTGHYYRNREAVLTGQGANATVLPMAVESLLDTYRIVGPL